MRVRSGLESLAEHEALLRGRHFAVLANQAAVTSDLVPAWRCLAFGAGSLVRIFAPEHGLWGVAQDMEAVASELDGELGTPVVSLYGSDPATLAPRAEMLEDLDAVVLDLPDIGCRYYTFAATMAHAMAACERSGVEVIVADRPNPLGGLLMEGGPVTPACRSFVSELSVPIRHGMTIGELALLLRAQRHPGLVLTVVPCSGWKRAAWWDETGLPWVAPSPNMPTLDTAVVYPGACLVEATTLSEGRGTTMPFLVTGAPWLDSGKLERRLRERHLPGVCWRATRFRPAYQKHAGELCHGVAWHVTDRATFRPLLTGVVLLREVRALHPSDFGWRREAYEFVDDVPAIDLLTGSSRVREVIEGGRDLEQVKEEWESHCASFALQRREHLLYE